MANRRDDQRSERRGFEDRWRDNPYRHNEGERHSDYERNRYSSHYNPEYYGERISEQQRWEEPEWQRERNEEHWRPRGDYARSGRSFEQGQSGQREEFRDRPYSTSTSYSGRGGYESHLEPYRENRERGY